MDPANSSTQYGVGDATYQAAGGLDGITRLVNSFYDYMDTLPEARRLRDMHAEDLGPSRQKLVYFLSGWMGGPKLYAEHFGSISIPVAHSHLPVDMQSKDAWLLCMEKALADQGYPESFRQYIVDKLSIPAESIRLMAEFKHGNVQARDAGAD